MPLRILIVTHDYDAFEQRPYLLRELSGHWTAAGHTLQVMEGLREPWPEADVAIVHVDQSLVPAGYAQACARYPVVINGRATDIRKKAVSRQLLKPGDAWDGPVIVKTDLNRGGAPEARYVYRSKQEGRAFDAALESLAFTKEPYPILRSMTQVPDAIWQNPGLVVERFLPEREPGRGFWVRTWVFFGAQERCTRYLAEDPLVKAGNILARETVPVPDVLRAERERLGFDFGKFDFVEHAGQAILLDAARTPFAPPANLNPEMEAANARLAQGLFEHVGRG